MGRPRIKLREEDYGKLQDAWNHDFPSYLEPVDLLTVNVSIDGGWEGSSKHRVTLGQVVNYYLRYSGDMIHSARELGTAHGDWRNMDYLADELLNGYFRVINPKAVDKEIEKVKNIKVNGKYVYR